MQDANLELQSNIAQVAEESGRVKSENVRLKADNDRLHEEVRPNSYISDTFSGDSWTLVSSSLTCVRT